MLCLHPNIVKEYKQRLKAANVGSRKYNSIVFVHTEELHCSFGHRNKDKIHVDNVMGRHKSWTMQSSQKQLNCFHYRFGFIYPLCHKKKNSWKSFSAFQHNIIFHLASHAWGLTATCSWRSKQNKCGHISSKPLLESKLKQRQSLSTAPPFP